MGECGDGASRQRRTRAGYGLPGTGWLADSAKAYPAQLSGGMRRRAAIARALAFDADFLLLDEPFTGLDETLWRGIAAEIRRVYADRLIVLITHIPAEAQAKAAVLPLPPAPLHGELRFPLSEQK